MCCPWIVTSAIFPSSTACTKRLKETSGSRGCCLVTIDQSSTAMSNRRSQRPRLREVGFNCAPGRPEQLAAKITHGPGSGNRESCALLEHALDHVCGGGRDHRPGAAGHAGDPENAVPADQ